MAIVRAGEAPDMVLTALCNSKPLIIEAGEAVVVTAYYGKGKASEEAYQIEWDAKTPAADVAAELRYGVAVHADATPGARRYRVVITQGARVLRKSTMVVAPRTDETDASPGGIAELAVRSASNAWATALRATAQSESSVKESAAVVASMAGVAKELAVWVQGNMKQSQVDRTAIDIAAARATYEDRAVAEALAQEKEKLATLRQIGTMILPAIAPGLAAAAAAAASGNPGAVAAALTGATVGTVDAAKVTSSPTPAADAAPARELTAEEAKQVKAAEVEAMAKELSDDEAALMRAALEKRTTKAAT